MKSWKSACILLFLSSLVAGADMSRSAAPLELNRSDLADASVTPGGEQSTLNVTLTEQGARKMRQFSAHHLGERISFVVNGQVPRTPVLKAPIQDGKVAITYFPEKQALEFARLIHQQQQQ